MVPKKGPLTNIFFYYHKDRSLRPASLQSYYCLLSSLPDQTSMRRAESGITWSDENAYIGTEAAF